LFSVRDVYLPGLEEKYLNLTVTDVNEAPVLTILQTTYDTIEQSVSENIDYFKLMYWKTKRIICSGRSPIHFSL
jgi:hypothetical protein